MTDRPARTGEWACPRSRRCRADRASRLAPARRPGQPLAADERDEGGQPGGNRARIPEMLFYDPAEAATPGDPVPLFRPLRAVYAGHGNASLSALLVTRE